MAFVVLDEFVYHHILVSVRVIYVYTQNILCNQIFCNTTHYYCSQPTTICNLLKLLLASCCSMLVLLTSIAQFSFRSSFSILQSVSQVCGGATAATNPESGPGLGDLQQPQSLLISYSHHDSSQATD